MGLLSSSKSKSQVTTTTSNANQQDIGGIALANIDGPVSLNLSDQGAIEAGFGAFSEAVSFARDALDNSFTQSETVAGLASGVLARESTNTDPRLQNVTFIALGIAGLVIAIVLFKG